jgi:hypothetical protein
MENDDLKPTKKLLIDSKTLSNEEVNLINFVRLPMLSKGFYKKK